MEFKGTKGPWENCGGDNLSVEISLPTGATIVVDRSDKNTGGIVSSREEMEANAALIAAAPDLLNTLESLHTYAMTTTPGYVGSPTGDRVQLAITAALGTNQ